MSYSHGFFGAITTSSIVIPIDAIVTNITVLPFRPAPKKCKVRKQKKMKSNYGRKLQL